MKNWIYYLVPLVLLIAMVLLPSLLEKGTSGGLPPPPPNLPPAQRAPDIVPVSTPWPQSAANPRGQMLDINYLDLATGVYQPLSNGGTLPADVFHFNAKLRNVGDENILVYYDLTQGDGPRLEPLGAREWLLPPGQEVFLFMQGANLKPAGKNVQLTFVMKERGTDKVLDQKTLNVTSR